MDFLVRVLGSAAEAVAASRDAAAEWRPDQRFAIQEGGMIEPADPLHVSEESRHKLHVVAFEIMDQHGPLATVVLMVGCAIAIGRYTGLTPEVINRFLQRAWAHVEKEVPQ